MPPNSADAADPPIDVRDLIQRHTHAEHAALADAYFASMPEHPKLLRKPFFGLRDTAANMHGLSEVLTRANLFPGAVVMDFGAGTGWLSKVLAFIECRPIAVDVSAAALALGRRAFEADPVAAGLSIDWRSYDGRTLPAEDGSIDRIISFDAFHHVADQGATLAEFYRVLRTGGRAVFHEPGPLHSRSPQSQYEMRHFGVVENDIVLPDIWAVAEALGFSNLRVAAAAPQSATFSLDRYTRILEGRAGPDDMAAVMAQIVEGGANLRIFSFDKGAAQQDSRHGVGLAGRFEVEIAAVSGEGIRGRARVTNTGHVRWLASRGETGSVALGVKEAGAAVGTPDYGRVWLSDSGIEPGEAVEVPFHLPPPTRRPMRLVFDLVSEQVTWFEPLGSQPVVIEIA